MKHSCCSGRDRNFGIRLMKSSWRNTLQEQMISIIRTGSFIKLWMTQEPQSVISRSATLTAFIDFLITYPPSSAIGLLPVSFSFLWRVSPLGPASADIVSLPAFLSLSPLISSEQMVHRLSRWDKVTKETLKKLSSFFSFGSMSLLVPAFLKNVSEISYSSSSKGAGRIVCVRYVVQKGLDRPWNRGFCTVFRTNCRKHAPVRTVMYEKPYKLVPSPRSWFFCLE